MRNSAYISLLIVLGLMLTMWGASLALYDARKSAHAQRWLQAERTGNSPFAWTFDARPELAHGHGVDEFTFADGVLAGNSDDPYFYLNLRGRYIDARRFDRLRLRVYSETENNLRLFHLQADASRIHASRQIPLVAGWQVLELDLPALDWKAKILAPPEQPEQPSGWGGEDGLVMALRIDPVERGAFALDELSLESSSGAWPVSEGIETFGGLDAHLFARMRSERKRVWVIAQDRWLRTPESAHWTREQIAHKFPSAILFPRPPGDGQLAVEASDSPITSRTLPVVVYLLGLGLLLGALRPPGSQAATARPILEFAGFLLLFEGCIFLLPQVGTLLAPLLAAPLLLAAWLMRPRPTTGLVVGDARAWLLVSPMLLLGMVLIWAAPQPVSAEGPVTVSIPRELGLYFLWALLQQYLVAVLLMGRLQPLLGRAGVVLSAGFFGWLHFPNFALMVATFLLGLVLLTIYRRHPNLPAIAAAQAMLSVGFNGLALQFYWLSREVGPAFLATL